MTEDGLRHVFTVGQLYDAFRLLVDDATARTMTVEWLNTRGYRVQGDLVFPEVEAPDDWPELDEGEEDEREGWGWDEASPPVIVETNRMSELSDEGAAFVRSCAGAPMAEVMKNNLWAFARSFGAIDQLVAVAFPAVIARYEQAGVWVPQRHAPDTERAEWVRMIRVDLLRLGGGECVPVGQLITSALPPK